MSVTNIEVSWLVKEFKELEGCYFEKMQDIDGGFKIKLTSPQMIFMPGESVFMTRYSRESKPPSNISMFARKHLRGSKAIEVSQAGFDRVVRIKFDNGYTIVMEIFSKGNLIIEKDGKTLHCLRHERWKDRVIKPGKLYTLPKPQGLDPREVSIEEFKKIFDQKDIIRSMVKHLNMSGKYLEEVCFRAGINKNKEEPTDEEILRLFSELKKILDEYKPGIQGEPVIVELKSREDKFEPRKTFNEAVDDYYSSSIETEPKEDKKQMKLEKRLKEQEKAIGELEEKIKKGKANGDMIYAHLYELQGLFARINQMKKDGKSWEEISNELGVEINPKTRKLKIKLD